MRFVTDTDAPPSALLTESQREYLRGDAGLAEATARAYDSRIRRRLQAGLTDPGLILNPAGDRKVDLRTVADSTDEATLRQTVREWAAFAFQLATAAGLDGERLVKEGMMQNKGEMLAERFRENPEALTIGELRDLQRSGAMDSDEIGELLEADRPPIGRVGEDEVLPFLRDDQDEK